MKTHVKNLFLLPVLIAALGLILAGRVTGQTFTTLHSFTAISQNGPGPYTNSDGANPYAGLVLSGNTLYGAAHKGGTWENGTLFKVKTNGMDFTTLHSFGPTPPYPGPYTNEEGAFLKGGLVLESNTLFGTTYYGGTAGRGTVFKVNIDGTGFTNLHIFTDPDIDGAYPVASLRVLSNTLYGTTSGHSSTNFGTVFAVNTDGTGFSNLHNFRVTQQFFRLSQ